MMHRGTTPEQGITDQTVGYASYCITAWTGTVPSRARPSRKVSSTRKAQPTMSPPSPDTSWIVAAAVPRREQVVDDEDALPGRDGVGVDLQRVGTVLERIRHAYRLGGQLPRLSHRHEPGLQTVCQRRAEDEAAALHPDHQIDTGVVIRLPHRIEREAQPLGIAQQRGDVVEENSRFRKVRDVTNLALEQLCGHLNRSFRGAVACDQLGGKDVIVAIPALSENTGFAVSATCRSCARDCAE